MEILNYIGYYSFIMLGIPSLIFGIIILCAVDDKSKRKWGKILIGMFFLFLLLWIILSFIVRKYLSVGESFNYL